MLSEARESHLNARDNPWHEKYIFPSLLGARFGDAFLSRKKSVADTGSFSSIWLHSSQSLKKDSSQSSLQSWPRIVLVSTREQISGRCALRLVPRVQGVENFVSELAVNHRDECQRSWARQCISVRIFSLFSFLVFTPILTTLCENPIESY